MHTLVWWHKRYSLFEFRRFLHIRNVKILGKKLALLWGEKEYNCLREICNLTQLTNICIILSVFDFEPCLLQLQHTWSSISPELHFYCWTLFLILGSSSQPFPYKLRKVLKKFVVWCRWAWLWMSLTLCHLLVPFNAALQYCTNCYWVIIRLYMLRCFFHWPS